MNPRQQNQTQCSQDTPVTGFPAQFISPNNYTKQTQVNSYPAPLHVQANATHPWVNSYALNANAIPPQVNSYVHQLFSQPWVNSCAIQANTVHPHANAFHLQVDSYAITNTISPQVKSNANLSQHPYTIHQQVTTRSIFSQSNIPTYVQPNSIDLSTTQLTHSQVIPIIQHTNLPDHKFQTLRGNLPNTR